MADQTQFTLHFLDDRERWPGEHDVPESLLHQRFLEFHRENLHVYDELRDLALRLKRKGHAHYGIGGLFEVLRWHKAMDNTGEFKLNNNHRAFYARLLMRCETELSDFFQLREQGPAAPVCED